MRALTYFSISALSMHLSFKWGHHTGVTRPKEVAVLKKSTHCFKETYREERKCNRLLESKGLSHEEELKEDLGS